ncbi:DUF4115 domain-containing protein [Altererythrobacter arenosus]|uniref:DUF4115 domain-containing protein n=1 Tax=Altererythrobacter arenosus TaxID=3032592 RepID=A0ABY8FVP1_9SPHN|nr:helix-turn-helix domain-containing protein [Altererythrobacter sp. CAU 1644]WFL78155.1 DUF4115 domain-containing protein [Altererythrobacter sp. CAU 1644]
MEQEDMGEAATQQRSGVGDTLRKAREAQGLTLAQVASDSRIPIRHLELIESGRFSDLPARTYAIGFSRTYAKLVGLDDREIADLVRGELSMESGLDRGDRVSSFEPGDPAKVPSAGLAWAGGIAAILLIGGAIAFYSSYYAAGTGPDPLQPAQSEMLAGENGPAGATAAAAQGPAQSVVKRDGQVVFTALEDGVWVRFYDANGAKLLEKQMASGERFEIPADAQEPRINTGRPDAFAITIGGQQVPKLADQPMVIGDAPVSAAALLARAETSANPSPTALN